MKPKVYRTPEVILYLFEQEAGEEVAFNVLDDLNYANDKTLKEAPRFTVNKVTEGEVTVEVTNEDGVFTSVADASTGMPETTRIGSTKMTVTGGGNFKAFCFSRVDKRILSFAEAPVLEDGEEFTLHSEGFLTVGRGAILINEAEYSVGALIKVTTVGTVVKSIGKTFLGYIGNPA